MVLGKNVKVQKVASSATAATGTTTSSAVDMLGFEGCIFISSIGTANAGNYGKVQQSSDDGGTDAYADLLGTKNVPGDSGDCFLIDIVKPGERYLKCLLVRGASSTHGEIYAIQYGAHKGPTTHGTTVDAETHVSPSEGTA